MSSPKKVLGLIGSARRRGNTDILVDEVLDGVEENGGVIEKVYLSALNIMPCRGCNTCETRGKCVHDDDLNGLVKKMIAADAWVFGTPVYYWGPTAQFKVFMDRWYGIDRDVFLGKRVVIVMPLGADSEYYARHAVGMMKDSSEYMKLEICDILVVPNVFEKGEVVNKPKFLSYARTAGTNLLNS